MKYFGYGTLLTLEGMQSIAPSATIDGAMRLDGLVLGFGKCSMREHAGCTLLPDPDGVTYGLQFNMSAHDMERLDQAAHVPSRQWVHQAISLTDNDGNTVESSTFVIPGEFRPWAPTDAYVAPIYRGLDSCPFPDDYKSFVRDRIVQAQSGP